MVKFQPPKGTKDLLPEDSYAWRATIDDLRNVLRSYGFLEIATPAFENIELFEAKAGEAIREQIYTIIDKSGRVLGLRSDLTPPVSRVVATYGKAWPKPIKICAVDKVWRYEAPQAGRYREIQHINGEMFGAIGPIADAEIISCFAQCYETVGLTNIQIMVGHRRLLQHCLTAWGVEPQALADVVRVIDKQDKIDERTFDEEVVSAGLPISSLVTLRALLNLKGDPDSTIPALEKLLPELNEAQEAVEELQEIFSLLHCYGVISKCVFAPGLARGFDYYTGVLFECVYPNPYGIGAIGGGGRYDGLVGIYGGEPLAATGFALGVDRIMILLEKERLIDKASMVPRPDYYIVVVDRTSQPTAISLACALRSSGHVVELNFDLRHPVKQLAMANRRKARKALFIGPDEVTGDFVISRDLDSGAEQRLSISGVLKEGVPL